MKKIISVLLAISLLAMSVIISRAAEPKTATNIEVIEVDLSESVSIGSSDVNITESAYGSILTGFAPGWFPCDNKTVNDNAWPDAVIALKNSDGDFITVSKGYKYAINVKYTVTKVDQTPQIALGYNAQNNSTQLNGFKTVAVSAKHGATGAYVLSAVVDGVDNRPLRIAFGGAGKIAIETVEIQRVSSNSNVKTVSYVDEGRTTKEFVGNTFKTPEFIGAIHTVFGGWYTDAAFKTPAAEPIDGGTYYAKWTSVTREIDLKNLNRMEHYNEGQDTTELNISNVGEGLKVDINRPIAGDVWAGAYGHGESKQQITLEYVDYDDAVQDQVYNNYVVMKPDRRYAINIKFDATEVSGKAQISVVASNYSLKGEWANGGASIPIVITNSVSSKGSYNFTGSYKSGELLDSAYGGVNNANKKLRLAFEGNGTFVIQSITIQEIYSGDSNTVAVQYKHDGLTYRAAAVKNAAGKWEIPAPNLAKIASKGNVVDFAFGGWFNDENHTNAMGTPVLNTVYYPKWESVTKEADLKNTNKMASADNRFFTYTAATDTTPLIVVVDKPIDGDNTLGGNGHDSSHQQLTLEYYDEDPAVQDSNFDGYVTVKDSKQYYVTVKYKVTAVSEKAQLSVVASSKALSWESSTPIVALCNITETGSFVYESGAIYVGNNNVSANDRLRLAFEGNATIEIESVLIKEVALGDDYAFIVYKDGDNSFTEYVKKGSKLSDPKDMTGFGGWYRSSDFIGRTTIATENCTVYAKRDMEAYSFQIDFDTQSTKDFYGEEHTKSDWANTGGKAELVLGAGVGGTDAMRLTYKEISSNMSDYATNPLIWLHDTNVINGDKIAKRFNGVTGTRYLVTLKYKAEVTDNKEIEIYVGTRKKSNSTGAYINDFGSGAWQIMDTSKLGNTITSKTDNWVTVKGYITARSDWFPVILIKTNGQKARLESESGNAFASVLIDDISVTEVLPIINDTKLGTMDYEDYEAKVYDSTVSHGIIGNKNGLEVSTEANHTANGKNSLKLTIQSDSLQYTGNTVISFNKEPFVTTNNATYQVKFWVMSKNDLNDVIWGVNSVAGSYEKITAKHHIEIRDKVNLKANEWKEITAYIPKLQSIPESIGMLSVAIAANGYEGKNVYIDDISVKQIIDSEAIIFADSHTAGTFDKFVQRAFQGHKLTYLPSVSKTGYLFDGWYDTPACDGREYKVNDIFPEGREEITLYAKWISTENVPVTNFTAGSFDPEIYNSGVVPYENVCEESETPMYGIVNADSTQSAAWVKNTGMYGNGTAELDGTLALQNDTYSKFTDTSRRNAIALVNEDGSKFMVVKGQKYTIKFDYINGSSQGTSVVQTYISTESGYGTFGNNKGQALKHIAVHGTDSEYKTYEEGFVADYTGFVYLTFTARSDNGSPHTMLYHRVYIDNLEIKSDESVKKINFIADSSVYKTVYGRAGEAYPVFDAIQGDERTTEFDGFYSDPEFKNLITDYRFTDADLQNVYIKYKEVKYNTQSDFSKPINIDFEEDHLDDYYRQGKHMTYWQRGELNPEWQLMQNNSSNAYKGSSYIKLNGYATYWNEAKFVLYDVNNPSGTMLLEKGATYRVKVMSRCEDKYDIPNLTITLENPLPRYLTATNDKVILKSDNVEYTNGYMLYTADITVPETLTYLPSLAIRKNENDLQTLYIDTVSVEKLVDYSVSFEENGGTEMFDITVQVHEKIDDPGMPFKDGYDFKGWYYDSAMTKLWDFENMTVEGNVTLYAKWAVAVPEEEIPEEITPDEDVTEETSRVPNLLEGDKYNRTIAETESGMATWIIILICVGGALVLSGAGVLCWLLIARKKKKN